MIAEERGKAQQAAGHVEGRLALLPTGQGVYESSVRTGLTMDKGWTMPIPIMPSGWNVLLMCSF